MDNTPSIPQLAESPSLENLVVRALVEENFRAHPEASHRWLLSCLDRAHEEVLGVLPEWSRRYPGRSGPADGLAWASRAITALRHDQVPTLAAGLRRRLLQDILDADREMTGQHRGAFHTALAVYSLVLAVGATGSAPPPPSQSWDAVSPLIDALTHRAIAASMRDPKDWTVCESMCLSYERAVVTYLLWRLRDHTDAAELAGAVR